MGILKKKTSIVITSIFEPTEAVKEFSALTDYNLIVVGDKKSPLNWKCENTEYLSVASQENLPFTIVSHLPFNHYSRKMLGYLKAIKDGAEFIVDTDDDNIPNANWNFPELTGIYDLIKKDNGFVNIYHLFTDQKIWPRGLPLHLINTSFRNADLINPLQTIKVGIWQGLADEDPDVDAIYRMTDNTPCYFNDRNPVVLEKGSVCPFNTQNTLIAKELFPLLYLPTFVTFRFTDILRGLIAQPIMWLYGYHLGFTKATVVQKRNPHDYMKDFISEMPMYEYGEKVIDIISRSISAEFDICDNLHRGYSGLLAENIVTKEELVVLEKWITDIKKLIG